MTSASRTRSNACARRRSKPSGAAPEVADGREGKKTAILDKARETKQEAEEMMRTYLEDADGLDGFEFLTMAEAAEVGHWSVLGKLNEQANRERSASWSTGRCRSRSVTSSRPRRVP